MALILNIETATTVCSVALAQNGKFIAEKEIDNGYSHSENLAIFIKEVLAETGKKPTDLNAIAISKGPGSYTGLRIGVSTAKGLCYALNIPLIAVPTLEVVVEKVLNEFPPHEGRVREGQKDAKPYHTADMEKWYILKERAREFRKNPTPAEKVMWQELRRDKLGHKIRRQHTIGPFVVDFVCLANQTIIEIDGKIHEQNKEKDEQREYFLMDEGYTIIRVKNKEVENNLAGVLEYLKVELDRKSPTLTLPSGEGTETLLCPMLDARRMEVYTALYDIEGNEKKPVCAEIIDEGAFQKELENNMVYFFGNGAEKCKSVLGNHSNANFIDGVYPSAKSMAALSQTKFDKKEFEDVAYFEPFYLKDFVATTPKKLI